MAASSGLSATGLFRTPLEQIVCYVADGGHIGLFMGSCTLAEHWPNMGARIFEQDRTRA